MNPWDPPWLPMVVTTSIARMGEGMPWVGYIVKHDPRWLLRERVSKIGLVKAHRAATWNGRHERNASKMRRCHHAGVRVRIGMTIREIQEIVRKQFEDTPYSGPHNVKVAT